MLVQLFMVVEILSHATSFWMCFIFGQITYVNFFIMQSSIQLYNISPTWASPGTHNKLKTIFSLLRLPEEAQVGETLHN